MKTVMGICLDLWFTTKTTEFTKENIFLFASVYWQTKMHKPSLRINLFIQSIFF